MEVAATAADEGMRRPDPSVAGPQDIALVYDRFFPRVYNYVRYRVGDRQTADDLTAEVFMRVLAKLDRYQPARGPFDAWLFAVARNAVNDHFRSLRWRSWLSLDLLGERPGREPSVEEALIDDEGRRRLSAALGRLEGRERDLLALKFAAGLTNRAIAAMAGLGESNVGVIVHRAVKKLQRELKGEKA